MALTKPNQDLRRDLKQAAALLKWSGVDLLQAARKLSEAGQKEEAKELLRIAVSFQETEDRLAGYADEVKAA
jgi:geranylgeranyl pyrophosphate synthase